MYAGVFAIAAEDAIFFAISPNRFDGHGEDLGW